MDLPTFKHVLEERRKTLQLVGTIEDKPESSECRARRDELDIVLRLLNTVVVSDTVPTN